MSGFSDSTHGGTAPFGGHTPPGDRSLRCCLDYISRRADYPEQLLSWRRAELALSSLSTCCLPAYTPVAAPSRHVSPVRYILRVEISRDLRSLSNPLG